MKLKAFLCCIIVVLFTFTGCQGSASDNSIELNVDNYTQYLVVDGGYQAGGNAVAFSGYSFNFYDAITCRVEISGASTNFNYNDVEVTVQIMGTYSDYGIYGISNGKKDISETITIPCNVGGSASEEFSLDIENYTFTKDVDLSLEVIDVSGT
ncbi:MAG: hypothetical protein LUE88_01845, partial [Clostridiales bacterium]|nr:hypothetical protein [Clostridiales bacterium]